MDRLGETFTYFLIFAIIIGSIYFCGNLYTKFSFRCEPIEVYENNGEYCILARNIFDIDKPKYENEVPQEDYGEYCIITFKDYANYMIIKNKDSFIVDAYISKYVVNKEKVGYKACSEEEVKLIIDNN